jgi:hypothetical protein
MWNLGVFNVKWIFNDENDENETISFILSFKNQNFLHCESFNAFYS